MQKYAKETSVGVFVLIGMLCVAYLTIQLGDVSLFSKDTYQLTARFSNVSGLKQGAAVEIAGVPVGEVSSIALDTDFGVAVVTLELRKDVQAPDDTIASVKTSGLIGDKFIKLSLGGSPDMLEPGDAITETESTLDIESLVSKYAFGDVEE